VELFVILKGQSAIVTGGNSGIGKAIVLALAEQGANVAVDYVSHPDATAGNRQRRQLAGDRRSELHHRNHCIRRWRPDAEQPRAVTKCRSEIRQPSHTSGRFAVENPIRGPVKRLAGVSRETARRNFRKP
jgi:NAD(P)-dependent dehydrogenase (short-subunit alcohol dehydrogenase family)